MSPAAPNVELSRRPKRVLYISYDGMTDPLGRSQVLPYLAGLSRRGHAITLVSCEKPEQMARDGEEVRRLCHAAGIDWQPLHYHKRPPILSSMLDVRAMKLRSARLHRRSNFDVVHCRSYMPAIVGVSLKRKFGVPFLFDMRGFWADERVERGIWPSGNPLFRLAYRYFKWRERSFFRSADAIVSLTDSAKREVQSWPEDRRPAAAVTVIPCCVDLDLFGANTPKAPATTRKRLGIEERAHVLLYTGSLGGAYLMPEMFQLFRLYRAMRPDARFLLVTPHDRVAIERLAAAQSIDPLELVVVAASRHEMPDLIAAGDVGVCFILATYSAMASCPTKFGEMLAMGVPVIVNAGVGDIAEIVRETGAGAVVERFDDASLGAAVTTAECVARDPSSVRAAAAKWFALEDGVERYDAIYRSIGPTSR